MNSIAIIFSVFASVSLAAAASSVGLGRVLGGSIVSIEDYPYIVSIRIKDRHFCGGSIITPKTILTAAHCFNNAGKEEITIRVGASVNSKGEVYKVASVLIHERYNPDNMQYDVALMELQRPLIYGPTVQPIGMATKRPRDGAPVIVIGWGMYEVGSRISEDLRAVLVPLIPSTMCDKKYSDVGLKITSQMVCASLDAGKFSSCPGDSGGPLLDVSTGDLLGIVSFGKGCGNPAPGVYASVPDLRQWILLHLE